MGCRRGPGTYYIPGGGLLEQLVVQHVKVGCLGGALSRQGNPSIADLVSLRRQAREHLQQASRTGPWVCDALLLDIHQQTSYCLVRSSCTQAQMEIMTSFLYCSGCCEQ